MARGKRNKVFDLFKSDFKISFFYKPTFENNDDFYIIVLNDVIRLRIKVIDEVIVIDSSTTISKTYVTPIYDKILDTIINQDKCTVLLSLLGDNINLYQSSLRYNLPIIDDENYLTTSKELYQRWKMYNDDISTYGFCILSVSEQDDLQKEPIEPKQPVAVTVKQDKPKEHIKERIIEKPVNTSQNIYVNSIVNVLTKNIPEIVIDGIDDNIIHCRICNEEFNITIIDKSIYIKDLLQSQEPSSLNLIKILELINGFEKLLSILPDVFIVSIYNNEIYRLCLAKNYQLIEEGNNFPVGKLFKQAFHGYGTYKIVVRN